MSNNPFSKELKRFSLISPVYKDRYKDFERFFQCLDEQDYQEFEVIISFDGPNPRGLKELEKIRKQYPKMEIYHTVNTHGGAPKARNAGVKLATGDYYAFLDADMFLYPDTLRYWANQFEQNPDKDVVWGLYDIEMNGQAVPIGGAVPTDHAGVPIYWAFRFSNYCSGGFPMRREAFVGWDEKCLSLQDWDMWVRMLKQDNFEGRKFQYCKHSFFLTDAPRPGGISDDSNKNWLERVKYVKEKNGIPTSDICVVSLGAPFHGMNVAKAIGADYLPDPMYKPNNYKMIYLLGFYTPYQATESHMNVFRHFNGVKVIHWIGTDIYQLHTACSFQKIKALRKWFDQIKAVLLTEADFTQEEMREVSINTKVVPIPPQKLYSPLPLPKKFTVAIYENATQNMYGEELMQEVARSLPDIDFKFFGNEKTKGQKHGNVEHLGWVNMDELLPEVSCNVRITIHDGLPLTPLQFLTAGRQVVSNTKLKGAILAKADRKSVVEAIRQAQKATVDQSVVDYWVDQLDKDKFKKAIWGLL